MEPVYVKRFIKTADDLPKDGTYFAYLASAHQVSLMKMSTGYKPFWIEDVEWFFEPVEMPTEEEQIIYFNNHSAAIEIKPSGLKLPLMTRSEVLKFANWLLSRLK